MVPRARGCLRRPRSQLAATRVDHAAAAAVAAKCDHEKMGRKCTRFFTILLRSVSLFVGYDIKGKKKCSLLSGRSGEKKRRGRCVVRIAGRGRRGTSGKKNPNTRRLSLFAATGQGKKTNTPLHSTTAAAPPPAPAPAPPACPPAPPAPSRPGWRTASRGRSRACRARRRRSTPCAPAGWSPPWAGSAR